MSPRDLTEAERRLLLDAQQRYEHYLKQSLLERDRVIEALVADEVSVPQIAKVLGLTRQGVYDARNRVRGEG